MVATSMAGALIGAMAGGKRGLAIGAGTGLVGGGALCAVMAVLDAQDKERIREAQLEAARSGEPVFVSYAGDDGGLRTISVSPKLVEAGPKVASLPARPPSARPAVPAQPSPEESFADAPRNAAETAALEGRRICRDVSAEVTKGDAGAVHIPQIACRNADGEYEPVTEVASQ